MMRSYDHSKIEKGEEILFERDFARWNVEEKINLIFDKGFLKLDNSLQ